MVVLHGISLTGAGLLIGLFASWAATRVLKNLLYGVSTADPATFAVVSSLLIVIALAASWIPAPAPHTSILSLCCAKISS